MLSSLLARTMRFEYRINSLDVCDAVVVIDRFTTCKLSVVFSPLAVRVYTGGPLFHLNPNKNVSTITYSKIQTVLNNLYL